MGVLASLVPLAIISVGRIDAINTKDLGEAS